MTDISHTWPSVTEVPATMRAVSFTEFSAPTALEVIDVPTPAPGDDEVLVRVGAVTLSRFLDLLVRHGRVPGYDVPLPHILGAESAGTVVAIGPSVSDVAVGDHVAVNPVYRTPDGWRIVGVHRQGATAGFVTVPSACVTVVPADADLVEVCASALSGPVAMTVVRESGIRAGTSVLVQGAGSGLGSTIALLARQLGADVAVAAPREEQLVPLSDLGFDHVYSSMSPDFSAAVLRDRPQGFDVVVHNMGVPRVWDGSMAVVASGGSIVSTGAYAGSRVPLDLRRLASDGLTVKGIPAADAQGSADFWEIFHAGFRAHIARVLPATEIGPAHNDVEGGKQTVGKIILTVPTSW